VLLKSVAIALLVPPTPLLLLALVGLLALAIPAVSGSLLVALEGNLPLTPPGDAPPQAIVILSGDILRGQNEMQDLHPGALSLERERAGAALFRQTGLPVLVTGGPLRRSETPISVVMADSLLHDFQVPVKWVERTSADTWGNAHRSADILHEQGIRSVYVVTQAWHMRRAILAFADTGIAVTAAPTRIDRVPIRIATDFLPGVRGWRASFYAMHEWIGCAYYALR
jgi:uncharacterized SAM-binding protein YcdF (DUF218 family)